MATYKPRIIQINEDNTFAICCTSPEVETPPRLTFAPSDLTAPERAAVTAAFAAFRRVYSRRADNADLADRIAAKEAELTALKAAQAAPVPALPLP